MAVGVLLTWGLTQALVQPARDLTKVADALATGNLRVRTRSTMSPLRDLATQLAFKVTEAPAVLSQAVRGHRRG